MIGIGSGVSNFALIEWATEHTAGMNKQMDEMMAKADDRSDETDAVSKIKEDLSAASPDPEKVIEAKKKLDALLEAHPDLADDLAGLKQSLDFEAGKVAGGAGIDSVGSAYAQYAGADGQWTTALNGVSESLKKDDDQGMLAIQNLNAEIQQAQQMASNLMSSNNQTISALINGIKG